MIIRSVRRTEILLAEHFSVLVGNEEAARAGVTDLAVLRRFDQRSGVHGVAFRMVLFIPYQRVAEERIQAGIAGIGDREDLIVVSAFTVRYSHVRISVLISVNVLKQ